MTVGRTFLLKTVFVAILFAFVAIPPLFSQIFDVYSVNADKFPKIQAFFHAKNQIGDDYQDLKVNEFEVRENGKNMVASLELRCDEMDYVPPVSVVMVLDASPSMDEPGLDSDRKFDWVEIAARAFIDSLVFTPKTTVAITAFAGAVVDWTGRRDGSPPFKDNKADLHTFMDNITTYAGRTNFNPPFLQPNLGAIDLLKTRPENVRRVIVFLTDGDPDDDFDKYQQVIDQCNDEKIQIYAITIDAQMFMDLGYAAQKTGGKEWEIFDKEDLTDIYSQIAEEIQNKKVCRLEWIAPYGCDEASKQRDLEITFRRINRTSNVSYTAPDESIAELELNSTEFFFGAPGSGIQSHDLTFTAHGTDFDIADFTITPDNGAFVLSENPSYTVEKDQSKTIQIQYVEDPPTESTEYTLEFNAGPCPADPITLIAPCGGEVVESVLIDNVPIGTSQNEVITCAFENTTAVPMIGDPEITGPDAAEFSFVNGGGNFSLAPGECHDVTIRFTPSDAEPKQAYIKYNILSDCGDPTTEITGEGISTDFPLPVMDWGDRRILTQNDSTYIIENTTTAAVTILSISWKHANDDNFTAQLPMVETTLDPGGTLEIPVSFIPQTEGVKENYLVLNIDGFTDDPEAKLIGNGYSPVLVADDHNFVDTKVGESVEENFSVGNESQHGPLYIESMTIIDNTAEFAFASGQQTTGLVIPKDGSIQVAAVFSPQQSGLRTAQLEIIHDGMPGPEKNPRKRDTITLSGNGVSLDVTPNPADFGEVSTCAQSEITLDVPNPGSEDMDIISADLTGDGAAAFDFEVVDQTIPGGGNGDIILTFAPETEGDFEANLYINTTAGETNISLLGVGTVFEYQTEFDEEYLKAQPGQNISIGFEASIPNLNTSIDYIKYIITYNPAILKYDADQGVTGPTTWTWDAQVAAPGRIEITGSGSEVTPTDLSHSVPFKTYLADDSMTVLTLATEFAPGFECLIDTPDEMSVDLQTCATQNRLIQVNTTKFSLAAPSPNPASGDITLDYAVGINAYTSIELYNSMGVRVAGLVGESLSPGSYEAMVNVSGLSAGVYFIRMQSGPYMKTRRLVISK